MWAKNKRIIYSEADCHRLVDIALNFKNVVECKKTDAITWEEKNVAWEKIAEIYNASTTHTRSGEQLRCKYDNLKKEVRRYAAIEKQNLYKTAGGLAESKELKAVIKSLYEKILSMISFSVKGLEASIGDSDCLKAEQEKCNKKTSNTDQLDVSNNDILVTISSPHLHREENSAGENQIVESVAIEDPGESKIEKENIDRTNYTPRMLKNPKSRVLQVKRKKQKWETCQCENLNYKMFLLQKELLEKEDARDQKFHDMKIKMEEELYQQKIKHQILQNKKLELELKMLEK